MCKINQNFENYRIRQLGNLFNVDLYRLIYRLDAVITIANKEQGRINQNGNGR